MCCYSNMIHSDHLNWDRVRYNSTMKHRHGNWYLHLKQADELIGSRGDLQTDTLQTSVNEVELWINITAGASFELKGRTSEGWKRLYFVDRAVPWTWIRIESYEPIMQLRFSGELSNADAFVTIDDIEAFSSHIADTSWQTTLFSLLCVCVCALIFMECSRSDYCACCASSRRQKPRGTALDMAEHDVPLGLELITVEGSAEHEGKIADEVDCIAF